MYSHCSTGGWILGNSIDGTQAEFVRIPHADMSLYAILTDIAPGNPAFRDELFGPVASFFRVKDEAAAIALANDSDFGLGGSVWTRDTARGERVASQVETGMMFVNTINWASAELPFGGVKNSGYGRELGNLGVQEFVHKKLVRTGHFPAPAWRRVKRLPECRFRRFLDNERTIPLSSRTPA